MMKGEKRYSRDNYNFNPVWAILAVIGAVWLMLTVVGWFI